MTYEISYHGSRDDVFGGLEQGERQRVQQKLTDIATNEFRQPRQWDFAQLSTHRAEGRFRVGDGLRVFADVCEGQQRIAVYDVARRENLY
jgi:mRNA-degrading endonuclease RelE of RelBE toxin-antitoxin system